MKKYNSEQIPVNYDDLSVRSTLSTLQPFGSIRTRRFFNSNSSISEKIGDVCWDMSLNLKMMVNIPLEKFLYTSNFIGEIASCAGSAIENFALPSFWYNIFLPVILTAIIVALAIAAIAIVIAAALAVATATFSLLAMIFVTRMIAGVLSPIVTAPRPSQGDEGLQVFGCSVF